MGQAFLKMLCLLHSSYHCVNLALAFLITFIVNSWNIMSVRSVVLSVISFVFSFI
jgi:hypothetical protein